MIMVLALGRQHVCGYRLHDGARLHSHVAPPSSQGRVWSRSQRTAGRVQPGAAHRPLRVRQGIGAGDGVGEE
jgi:hypothetical protein